MVNEQNNVEPPVRISVNRVEVVSGALFFANVMTIPILVIMLIVVVIAMIFVADFNVKQLLSAGILLVGVPFIVWIINFIFGMLICLTANGAMKFNKPKLVMQQI